MGAAYRPVATTLGVVALWAGLAAGVTAVFAGPAATRLWWPIHKVAAVALVLVWLHGVLGGGDTAALLRCTSVNRVARRVRRGLSLHRRTPADRLAELTDDDP